MSLDINTERGQETLKDEMRLAWIFESNRNRRYVHTPKALPCRADALIINDEHPGIPVIEAIVESKCRYDLSCDKLLKQFRGEWLVTFNKLTESAVCCEILQVPLYGFLFLVDDDVLLIKRLYTPARGWVAKFRVEQTETQATCNGGLAIRANAYIDMRDATILKPA